MGYFSNGSEGAEYEAKWCSRCVHIGACSVWLLHFVSNHQECNKPDSFLHTLIPRSPDGLYNEQCTMFYPVPPPDMKELGPDGHKHTFRFEAPDEA